MISDPEQHDKLKKTLRNKIWGSYIIYIVYIGTIKVFKWYGVIVASTFSEFTD